MQRFDKNVHKQVQSSEVAEQWDAFEEEIVRSTSYEWPTTFPVAQPTCIVRNAKEEKLKGACLALVAFCNATFL